MNRLLAVTVLREAACSEKTGPSALGFASFIIGGSVNRHAVAAIKGCGILRELAARARRSNGATNKEILAAGRRLGSSKLREDAAARKERARDFALNFFKCWPTKSYKECVAEMYMSSARDSLVYRFNKALKAETILSDISGCKEEAINASRTHK